MDRSVLLLVLSKIGAQIVNCQFSHLVLSLIRRYLNSQTKPQDLWEHCIDGTETSYGFKGLNFSIWLKKVFH